MTLEEEWQRWRERYDTTHNGVLRLFHDRAIWRTILAMLEANPAVARGGFGEYWLGSCYTTSQLIGIRRETGTDNKSVGMLRSLNNLASTPRMATRAWYRQQIAEHGHPEEDPERLFNRFAGPTQPFIDSGLQPSEPMTPQATQREALARTGTQKMISQIPPKQPQGPARALRREPVLRASDLTKYQEPVSGARGTRTPDPVLANRRHHGHRLNWRPLTCRRRRCDGVHSRIFDQSTNLARVP